MAVAMYNVFILQERPCTTIRPTAMLTSTIMPMAWLAMPTGAI
jgi:hypothetical protein